MKRTYSFIVFLVSSMFILFPVLSDAQERIVVPEGHELVDSVVYRPVSAVDTTLAGRDVFMLMPSKSAGDKADVRINQTSAVEDAVRRQISSNGEREMNGYRVRIFFDNRQTARVESEETLKRFESLYHDVAAYRTYANPYFKVTVGDFRTKSEAMRLLERIRNEFPSAFVVRENIEFPVVDRNNAFVADTIKVLRRKVFAN